MNERDKELVGQVEEVIKIIGAKWKPAIIFCLVFGGRQRFSDLRRQLPEITQKMLTQRLRELERGGLVKRTFHEEIPVRVEYELTNLGMSAHPFFRALCEWGIENKQAFQKANQVFDRR
ncbi:MAG: winged helix-turn-helix transcriptional regulator [Hyphomicrobiales bacterium]